MVLFQRKKHRTDGDKSLSISNENSTSRRKDKRKIIIRFVYLIAFLHILYFTSEHFHTCVPGAMLKGDGYSVGFVFGKATDNIDSEGNNVVISHSLIVTTSKSCNSPPIWIRVVGDALLHVPLTEEGPKRWVGSFYIPFQGAFKLESNWLGCDGKEEPEIKHLDFFLSGPGLNRPHSKEKQNSLFADSAWVTSEKVRLANTEANTEAKQENKYVWSDLQRVSQVKEMSPLTAANNSIVLKESIVTDYDAFNSFKELSNYELVCWIGSDSAEKTRGAFLAIRPQIFPHQRPFKFHYYPSTSFVTPDSSWDDDSKIKFRKCKHILISLDEPEKPLSQLEYKNQVTTFIKHLLNAFDEEHTFPALIWMFTVNESPIGTKNCHSPYLKKTTNHPCNDVLKDMFQDSQFPPRVQLLDNSEISLPVHGRYMDDVFAAIALRIYVIVGKQVKAWRDAGMMGGINGLTRNGVTAPNFDLVPYSWSTKLD